MNGTDRDSDINNKDDNKNNNNNDDVTDVVERGEGDTNLNYGSNSRGDKSVD
jgi:hypothetical protein